MPSSSTPEVQVGQAIEFKWPSGDSYLDLTATVRNIEESNKTKQGSKYVYTLDCSDGATRKTRLLCLDWAMASEKGAAAAVSGKKQQKRPRDGETEAAAGGDKAMAVAVAAPGTDGAKVLGKNAKKKARWTDGRNASTDALARTVYVRQIPYAASEKDLAKLFKGCSSARLLRNPDKTSKGMAFVEFKTELAASAALGMQGCTLQGRSLSVSKCVTRDEAREADRQRLEAKANASDDHEGAAAGAGTGAGAGAKAGGGAVERLDEKAVTALVAACARGSHGVVAVADFDSRCVEFMRALPLAVVKAALEELPVIPVVKDKKVANMGSYIMGLLKRFQAGGDRPEARADAVKGGKGGGKVRSLLSFSVMSASTELTQFQCHVCQFSP